MQVRYIGRKSAKADNVANTGITWQGHGDVQDVTDPIAAAKLLANDTIWALADPDRDGALLASIAAAEPVLPADVVPGEFVRKFIAMLLKADRLSVSDLPLVCEQLGIDIAGIEVPALEPEAPVDVPTNTEPGPAPASEPAEPAAPKTRAKAAKA